VAVPELVAAVANAGGFGILAGLGQNARELRGQIRRLRELTDRPFGVNLWLHTALQPPADPARIPQDVLRPVQQTLNAFRARLSLQPSFAPPAAFPDVIDEAFEVILEEKVALWSIGLGDPGPERVRRCRERGVKVMAMVATVEDARAVAASGVDLVVAQGGEAGGHRSTWVKPVSREAASIGTLVLVPQVVDAVRVPVLAAGGIMDGRGVVAALALGAAGVLMGTRFVATRESTAPEMWKKSLVGASSDRTTVTDAFTGLYARALRNTFSEDYAASGAPVLPPLLQANAAGDVYAASASRNDPGYFPMWSGQGVGLIRDLPAAGDVVRSIVREARQVLDSLGERVQR
jgi:nitronate monooxygenase